MLDTTIALALFDRLDEELLVAKLTGFEWDVARARKTQDELRTAGFETRWDIPR